MNHSATQTLSSFMAAGMRELNQNRSAGNDKIPSCGSTTVDYIVKEYLGDTDYFSNDTARLQTTFYVRAELDIFEIFGAIKYGIDNFKKFKFDSEHDFLDTITDLIEKHFGEHYAPFYMINHLPKLFKDMIANVDKIWAMRTDMLKLGCLEYISTDMIKHFSVERSRNVEITAGIVPYTLVSFHNYDGQKCHCDLLHNNHVKLGFHTFVEQLLLRNDRAGTVNENDVRFDNLGDTVYTDPSEEIISASSKIDNSPMAGVQQQEIDRFLKYLEVCKLMKKLKSESTRVACFIFLKTKYQWNCNVHDNEGVMEELALAEFKELSEISDYFDVVLEQN